MRSNLSSFIAILSISIGLAACGGSDDTTGTAIDARAGTIDARVGTIDAPAGGGNALGQVCSNTVVCPTGNACTGVSGVGSTTSGWCTPPCTQAGTECTTGYTGPAGGMPQCALTTATGAPPTQCAIICTTTAQCPTGLSCIAVPGQSPPVSICAPPA
jgi:hypothetical protein